MSAMRRVCLLLSWLSTTNEMTKHCPTYYISPRDVMRGNDSMKMIVNNSITCICKCNLAGEPRFFPFQLMPIPRRDSVGYVEKQETIGNRPTDRAIGLLHTCKQIVICCKIKMCELFKHEWNSFLSSVVR